MGAGRPPPNPPVNPPPLPLASHIISFPLSLNIVYYVALNAVSICLEFFFVRPIWSASIVGVFLLL